MDQLSITKEKLDSFVSTPKTSLAEFYELPEDLNDAIEIAMALNQPLLITGEPGTGKTLLADKIAVDLNMITNGTYNKEPYLFSTKSTSVFSDLFYTYDAISHFYDANIKNEAKPALKKHIELNALGMAIVASMESEDKLSVPCNNTPDDNVPRNSVVLIDEIDKAPNDFPNDLLHELEKYKFRIKEAGMREFSKGTNSTILIIITSNGEKNLPEAFLRRCVFFNIKFPETEFLLKILKKHELIEKLKGNQLAVLKTFHEIRKLCTYKKPSTAELIAWVKIIIQKDILVSDLSELAKTLPVIVKDNNDLATVLKQWNSHVS